MKINVSYVFDCPVHGSEIDVLCFRAFDNNNIHLWKKYEVSYRELPFNDDEKKKLIDDLRRSASGIG